MFRPAGISDSEEDSDSDCGLQVAPSGPAVTGQGQVGAGDDPVSEPQGEQEEQEVISSSLLSDLAQSVEAGDLDTVMELVETEHGGGGGGGGSVPVNTILTVWRWGELTPAGLAALHCQHLVLEFLLARGGHCGGEGFLLLATAGSEGTQDNLMKCAELISSLDNEDVNMKQSQGLTPLMIASKNGNRLLVQWLIGRGARLDLLDRMFWTALMFSVDSRHGDVARLLLDTGADPDIVNKDGQTAADLAGGNLQAIIMRFTAEEGRGREGRTERADTHTIREITHMEKALTSAGLPHLHEHIVKHKIDLETFLMLREEDMVRLGVEEVGDVKRLLICQAELHKEEWRTCSLPSLTAQEGWDGLRINMVTAINMVNIIVIYFLIKTLPSRWPTSPSTPG